MTDNQTKIKLIWDFRGETAQKIAEHHVVHLNEFTLQNPSFTILECNSTVLNPMYSIAYLITYKSEMIKLRDVLKPHRGEYIEEI